MATVGLSIETKDFKFDVFKKSDDKFEIRSGGIFIEFPADAVELRIDPKDDPYDPMGAYMSVKWGAGHRVHFSAYMPVRSAQDLNKHFPELKIVE
ncbi:hypothetical protein KCG43_20280 [Photobacterium sp. WH24]|uniref:hypothetical protein n=1 Tax=Photobacterium sp. WH24 TaxID=2827237 RepID=UPI001C4975A8|nr:hypothetical protein [Photobacterium sp. WH24]MBV7264353.1 hypothetical protein [Photobacterium sp. WH24]